MLTKKVASLVVVVCPRQFNAPFPLAPLVHPRIHRTLLQRSREPRHPAVLPIVASFSIILLPLLRLPKYAPSDRLLRDVRERIRHDRASLRRLLGRLQLQFVY